MSEGLIFANARAKALEQNLFSEERLYRMTECEKLSDAVRILVEAGYAGGMILNDPADFEKMLLEEQKAVTDFVREVAPKDCGIDCFFAKNDYHNIKSLLKAKYAKIESFESLIMPDGNMKFSEIKEKIDASKLDFSQSVNDALKIIDKKFELGEGTPRLIDTLIDKAMYTDISAMLGKKGTDRLVKEYFTALIDTTNISTVFRVYNIGGNVGFLESMLIEGGEIELRTFSECLNDPYAKLPAVLRGGRYGELVQKIEGGDLSSYETAQDNYLLKMFSANKSDMFTVAPILGYYLGKLNEIKVIRVVLVCIKNKVAKAEMKRRVRTLYA